MQMWETFPALTATGRVCHGFLQRVPGVEVGVDREAALDRLAQAHTKARAELGLADHHLVTARQIHGIGIAEVDARTLPPVEEVDALITADPSVCLAIYVADCCAVYLVDFRLGVIALAHSGKKGTDLGIIPRVIETMREKFGSRLSDLVVQLSPCIRPPHYEVDFAAEIARQCRAAGVSEVYDCGICTAENPERYYSYRRERGQTGRMLALMALRSS